jgi:vitamin B12 transporter
MSFEEEEMHPILFLAAAAAIAPQSAEDQAILVTATRVPQPAADAPASATIIDRDLLESLNLPMAADSLRLSPGLSVAQTGPRGTQTQVRIRGAEANHSLLFVDGIRFNDPAAGNEARFELLTTDMLSRIEIVRGPQSALWGSEALGGVIAVDSNDAAQRRTLGAAVEYGSLDSARATARFATPMGPVGLSGSAAWLRSDGIDSFAHGGERDGFADRAASLKAVARPLPALELGLVGHWIESRSDYDDVDLATFRRADTRNQTRNRIGAVRGWAGLDSNGWKAGADASWLGSINRNSRDDQPLNRTEGERGTLSGQLSRALGGHLLTAAIDHEVEKFRARDLVYGGATDQDRSRRLTALVGEWRAEWSKAVSTDLAIRHDSFSAFRDATTLRGALVVRPAPAWRIHAAYGEGIAQPTFYDLYGFFPGSFAGNAELKPERSRGWEAGIRWQGERLTLGITGFANRLRDEIVPTFDPATFLSSAANAAGRSRRRGVELEAGYRASEAFQILANYTWLDSDEQQVAGGVAVKEVRRPRHSFNLAASGSAGRFRWSATTAYVGRRTDTDFDLFPARIVSLDDYVLGSLHLGYALTPSLEGYARAENVFDSRYQDVVGYRTPGRTIYAGLRLRLGA